MCLWVRTSTLRTQHHAGDREERDKDDDGDVDGAHGRRRETCKQHTRELGDEYLGDGCYIHMVSAIYT